MAELQGRVDGYEDTAGDDNVGADDGVQASVAGYPGGARAVPVAGPAYLYSDGDRADLALYTTSCDITPLVVHKED